MAITRAEFTINDLNDIVAQPTPPSSPAVGQLWRNTNTDPNELLAWTGRSDNTARAYPVTKSGSAVSFDDLSDDRKLDVTVKTVATQAGSGTPSPSNVRAISGKSSLTVRRAGKNLFPTGENQTINGVSKVVNADGGVTLNGTASATTWFTMNLPVRLSGTFIMSANNPTPSSGVMLRLQQLDTTFPLAITLDAVNKVSSPASVVNGIFVDIRVAAGTVLSNFIIKPQLELGSTATTFEKYEAADYTLTPDATLYGLAGAEDEIGNDGNKTHKTKLLTLSGSSAFTWSAFQSADTTLARFTLSLTDIAPGSLGICSHFNWPAAVSGECIFGHGSSAQINIWILKSRMSGWSDAWSDAQKVAAFQGWLDGKSVQVLYQLATPTTATITPVEINGVDGVNTVTSDGASVTVEYTASGWAAVGAVQRIAIENVEITPEFGIKVTQVLTDGTNTKNVYTQLYSQGLKIFDADTGEMIGGLTMQDGEVFLFSSALGDPRVADGKFRTSVITVDDPDYPGMAQHGLRFGYDGALGGNVVLLKNTSGIFGMRIKTSGGFMKLESGTDVSGNIASTTLFGTARLESHNPNTYAGASIECDAGTGTNWVDGHLKPTMDNNYSCGSSAERWTRLFAANGSIGTSDERHKQDMHSLNPAIMAALLDEITPIEYRFKDNPGELRYGFGAQSLQAALDKCGLSSDLQIVNKENPDCYGLNNEQIIPILAGALKHERKRNDDLEARLTALEARLQKG